MTEITLLERLRLGHTTSGMKMLGEAADTIETQAAEIDFWKDRMREALKTIKENNDHIAELEKHNADCLRAIQSYSDLNREATKQNTKLRSTLVHIQNQVQDILRPIPFQEDEECY